MRPQAVVCWVSEGRGLALPTELSFRATLSTCTGASGTTQPTQSWGAAEGRAALARVEG